MVTPKQIEVALHKWSLWNESVLKARQELGFRLDFTEDELRKWEGDGGWEKAWEVVDQVLKNFVLPSSFAFYWLACFCSDYDPRKVTSYRRIKLPQRAIAKAIDERQPGAFLVRLVGTKTYKLDKNGTVRIEITDPERMLPPCPVEVLIPSLVPFSFGVFAKPGKATKAIPIIGIPFTKIFVFTTAPGTLPSPYITIRIPLFAPVPDWRWLRMQFDAVQRWLKVIGEHPLAEALKGERREKFYWKEQVIEKLVNAPDKKTALSEIKKMELDRERKKAGFWSKKEERKARTRVRKRVAAWAREAGIT